MEAANPARETTALLWDVFCRVIDNFGDIGVSWRLATQLAMRGHHVRLWLDDASALQWMAPGALQGKVPGVQVLAWAQSTQAEFVQNLPPANVWIETFGCETATTFIANYTEGTGANGLKHLKKWVNLEYLTAEAYAGRNHRLPSPVLSGPAAGSTKHFFYPGFTPDTGGLLRETDLPARQAAFDRAAWLAGQGIPWQGEQLISLFCYEPAALSDLLHQLAGRDQPTQLLVTHGRAAQAVQNIIQNGLQPLRNGRDKLSISYLPALTQTDYDHLLWACDLNFVRGEDSLVRAIWAGKPFVWQIYPQTDDAHHAKLDAFLTLLEASPSLRQFHHTWNGLTAGPLPDAALALQPAPDVDPGPIRALSTPGTWQAIASAARSRLMAQDDLTTQLIAFVEQKPQKS